jgi:hypothetical protein
MDGATLGGIAMDNATYQDMPCISSHWLKDMLDSPDTCYRKHLDPQRHEQKPSAAMQFGTLVHCLSLTPLQLGEEFIIDSYERRTKAGKARYAALTATGKIVITPDDFERARAIVAAMKAHPDARLLLTGGRKEQTIIQERERGLLPLKARLDIHHPDQRLVVELKTIHSLDTMNKAIDRYRYALSGAFYADIAQAETVQFIFVQTQEPYEVATFEMSRLQLQDGREQYQAALSRFDDCWKTGDWPKTEPTPELDDDPLMMNFMPTAKQNSPGRFDVPVGELAL